MRHSLLNDAPTERGNAPHKGTPITGDLSILCEFVFFMARYMAPSEPPPHRPPSEKEKENTKVGQLPRFILRLRDSAKPIDLTHPRPQKKNSSNRPLKMRQVGLIPLDVKLFRKGFMARLTSADLPIRRLARIFSARDGGG